MAEVSRVSTITLVLDDKELCLIECLLASVRAFESEPHRLDHWINGQEITTDERILADSMAAQIYSVI